MTTTSSGAGDNAGRCDGCDDPATVYQPQQAHPVMLGGGMGMGTMWLCGKCVVARGMVPTYTETPIELNSGTADFEMVPGKRRP